MPSQWGRSPNSVKTQIKPSVTDGVAVGFHCTLPKDKAEVLLGVEGRSRFLADFLIEHWDLVEKARRDRVVTGD